MNSTPTAPQPLIPDGRQTITEADIAAVEAPLPVPQPTEVPVHLSGPSAGIEAIPVLVEHMADLCSSGISKEEVCFEWSAPGHLSYAQKELSLDCTVTGLKSALGLSELGLLEGIVAECQRLGEVYRQFLAPFPEIPADPSPDLQLPVIRMDKLHPKPHRHVFEVLRDVGIGLQLHATQVYFLPFFPWLLEQHDVSTELLG